MLQLLFEFKKDGFMYKVRSLIAATLLAGVYSLSALAQEDECNMFRFYNGSNIDAGEGVRHVGCRTINVTPEAPEPDPAPEAPSEFEDEYSYSFFNGETVRTIASFSSGTPRCPGGMLDEIYRYNNSSCSSYILEDGAEYNRFSSVAVPYDENDRVDVTMHVGRSGGNYLLRVGGLGIKRVSNNYHIVGVYKNPSANHSELKGIPISDDDFYVSGSNYYSVDQLLKIRVLYNDGSLSVWKDDVNILDNYSVTNYSGISNYGGIQLSFNSGGFSYVGPLSIHVQRRAD